MTLNKDKPPQKWWSSPKLQEQSLNQRMVIWLSPMVISHSYQTSLDSASKKVIWGNVAPLWNSLPLIIHCNMKREHFSEEMQEWKKQLDCEKKAFILWSRCRTLLRQVKETENEEQHFFATHVNFSVICTGWVMLILTQVHTVAPSGFPFFG